MSSLLLDTIVGFVRQKLQIKVFKRLQWVLDDKWQLHRMAYEEVGQGVWSGKASLVLITEMGNLLGFPELADSKHPQLGKVNRTQEQNKSAHADVGVTETDGLMEN